jgi:hypothetical protein
MIKLTLLYVGTSHCINCLKFKPEWDMLKTQVGKGEIHIDGVHLTLEEYVVVNHSSLPLSLQNTVSFYPFIMILPTSYFEKHKDDDMVLVGEAMYTYRTMKDGNLQYRLGGSVNDSPNMRFSRTMDGILDWIRTCGMESLKTLSPRYYDNMEFEIRTSEPLMMKAMKMEDVQMEMFIAPLNKEYKVVPGGMVMCRRIINVHS